MPGEAPRTKTGGCNPWKAAGAWRATAPTEKEQCLRAAKALRSRRTRRSASEPVRSLVRRQGSAAVDSVLDTAERDSTLRFDKMAVRNLSALPRMLEPGSGVDQLQKAPPLASSLRRAALQQGSQPSPYLRWHSSAAAVDVVIDTAQGSSCCCFDPATRGDASGTRRGIHTPARRLESQRGRRAGGSEASFLPFLVLAAGGASQPLVRLA